MSHPLWYGSKLELFFSFPTREREQVRATESSVLEERRKMCWCWWWGATDSDISCLFYPWENLNESYNCRGLIDDNSLFSFFLFFVFLLWGGSGVKTNMRTESGESKWQHTEGICVSAIGESLYISISHSLHCQCCFFIQPSDRLHTARVCSDCVCVCVWGRDAVLGDGYNSTSSHCQANGELCRFVCRDVTAPVFRWGFSYDQKAAER